MLAGSVWAKLPAPSDEAKAKAAETAAKNAWNGKVAGYKLCKAQNAAAGVYYEKAKKEGRETKPPVDTAACVEPGPFVYTPPTMAASK
ncbi:MAG: hypothetical protein U5L05_06035 [Rubrivivax sp.]|nr:hypothetical protein [Rubrivivax sp.]